MRDCFEDVVRRQSAAVYRLAFSRLRNAADAEDVCQTVFLRLFRAAPDFADEEHERAWLLRTTVNCCNDAHRSAWRKHVLSSEGAREAVRHELDSQSLRNQSEQAAQDELSARIGAAMEALSEKQRTGMHLRAYADDGSELLGSQWTDGLPVNSWGSPHIDGVAPIALFYPSGTSRTGGDTMWAQRTWAEISG